MKINPLTIASTVYALFSKSKESNEMKDQKHIIDELSGYYDSCEKNKIYDAPAAIVESAVRSIKDNLSVSYNIRMGNPGITTKFSFEADVTITNNSEYDMDVVGLMLIPSLGGIQWGDVPGYTLIDYIDVNRLTGRYIGAGESTTINIAFSYLTMNRADRKTLRKLIKEKLGLKSLYETGSTSIRSSIEMVVKKDRTAFSDARYITYGLSETVGTLYWMGENYYVSDSVKDQETTIQNNNYPNKYGYLAISSFFSEKPDLLLNNGEQIPE